MGMGDPIMEKVPNIIPISKLNRGYAGELLEELKDSKEASVIVKNNEPIAVLLSVSQYNFMAANSGFNKIRTSIKKHSGAGALQKYAKADYVGKEEELYHQALNIKYAE